MTDEVKFEPSVRVSYRRVVQPAPYESIEAQVSWSMAAKATPAAVKKQAEAALAEVRGIVDAELGVSSLDGAEGPAPATSAPAEPEKPPEDTGIDLGSLGEPEAPAEPPMADAELKAELVALMQSENGVSGPAIKKFLTDNYGTDNPANVDKAKRRELIAGLKKLAG